MAHQAAETQTKIEKLSLLREVLIPALQAGIPVTTTGGQAVTLDNLALFMAAGAVVEMVGKDGRLIAGTVADDEEQIPVTPAFLQVRPDGRTIRYFLWNDLSAKAAAGWKPEPLRLSDDLFDVQRNGRGYLLRDATTRTAGKMRDKIQFGD